MAYGKQGYALKGNLAADPNVRMIQSANGQFCAASFTIMCNEYDFKTKSELVSAFDCKCTGKTAEFVKDTIRKGMGVVVWIKTWKQEKWVDKPTGQNRSKVVAIINGVDKIDFKKPQGQQQNTQPNNQEQSVALPPLPDGV